MIHAILSGIGSGLVLTLIPGPVFFALLQTSIQKGFRFAAFIALGIALSDLVYIWAIYYGISSFLENETFKKVIGIVGGIMMVSIGSYYFFKPTEKAVPLDPIQKETKAYKFILNGFALNVFNPSALVYWLGLVTVVSVKYDNNNNEVMAFFTCLVLTVLSADIFKSYIANKIKSYFTNNFLNKLNKGLGVILVGVGVKLLLEAFF